MKDSSPNLLADAPSMGREDAVRMTALVKGLVQGVGFRVFTRTQAQALGLSGSVENLADGRVEVVAEGARDDLELLLVRLRNGPAHSEVDDIEVAWSQPVGLTGFHVY